MRVVLNVEWNDLDQALSAAKSHLCNAEKEMSHSVDFYLADGSVKHYHSSLASGTVTVWRSEVVEG